MRQILHVAPSACQNLSLIVRGHWLHKAEDVSKDLFNMCVRQIQEESQVFLEKKLVFHMFPLFTIPGHDYTMKDVLIGG